MYAIPKRTPRQKIYTLTCFSTFGALHLISKSLNVPFAICIFLFAGFLSIYQKHYVSFYSAKPESRWIAFIYTLFLSLGSNWLDLLFNHSIKSFLFVVIAVIGLYSIILTVANTVLCFFSKQQISRQERHGSKSIRKLYWTSFIFLWIVYGVFFLNQYPGSLSCDTPQQLRQAMGDSSFENANPFINTLAITICIKLGCWWGGTVNSGIATYTIFQFTLASLIFAYTVTTIYKHGFSKYYVLFAQCFFNFVPYNIVYATGMWKDTFFAILFLATLTRLFDIIMDMNSAATISRASYVSLCLLTFLSSLSRNSGWSSLLVLGIFLIVMGLHHADKLFLYLSRSVMFGVIASIITILLIYPMFGIKKNGGITVGLSVPLQQVARVVAMDGELSEDDRQKIDSLIDLNSIPELYDETKSDNIKFNIDSDLLRENIKEYTILWIKLGIKNPKIYIDAYIHLTKFYWAIDSQVWTWDTRIFDNPYGVIRDSKLFPSIDLEKFLSRVYKIPKLYVTRNSSLTLWLVIFLVGLSSTRKNKLGIILLSPMLTLFVGLMITSPIALFRYTYAATVCIPLMLCFPFCKK